MQIIHRSRLGGIWLLSLLVIIGGKGYGQSFTLDGVTKDNDGKWLYLYYSDQNADRVTDSIQIKNNAYHFSGAVAGPSMVYMGLKTENGRLNADNSYSFFLEPGKISVRQNGDFLRNSLVTGSKTQAQYQPLLDNLDRIDQRWKVVMDTLDQANKRSNTEYQQLKDWVLLPYFAERDEKTLAFFRAYPQSTATAYLLRFYVSKLKIDSLQKYYNALGEKLQQSSSGRELAGEIARIRKGSPGSMATEFQTTGLNGKAIALSDFKGKYVLLDFWASWCVPCRASNPHLKELYHKYHDKGLEVIGVADDDGATDKWNAAVTKDGVGIWHNVLRGYDRSLKPGQENPKDISSKFGVQVLPTKILIDPEGKIIGRFTGTEDESQLDTALIKAFTK